MKEGGNNKPAPVVVEQGAGSANEKSGEKIDLKIAAALGKGAISATDLEGGIDTKIVLTRADKTDTDNAINEAVDAKLNERTAESKVGKWAQGVLKNNFLVKPFLVSAYRLKAGQAIRENGGDLNSAFEALGIKNESNYNNTGRDELGVRYAERRARMALEDDAFLNEGESVDKVEDATTKEAGDALKAFFRDVKDANGNESEIKKARETYENTISEMQKAGAFGDGEKQTLGNKILESGIVRYLVGDHSGRKLTQVDALMRAADGAEALASENIDNKKFDDYIDNHLSLYNADMKEGTYTKQKVNSVMAAIAAGGVVGGITYTFIGRDARSGVRSAVKDTIGDTLSSTATSAVVGGAAGFAAGVARGLQQARVKASKAEIEAATSAEELKTTAELAKEVREIDDDLQMLHDIDIMQSRIDDGESNTESMQAFKDELAKNRGMNEKEVQDYSGKMLERWKGILENNKNVEGEELSASELISDAINKDLNIRKELLGDTENTDNENVNVAGYAKILNKIGATKRALTGENKVLDNLEKIRDRKSAKELYQQLELSADVVRLLNSDSIEEGFNKLVQEKGEDYAKKVSGRVDELAKEAKEQKAVTERVIADRELVNALAEIRARNKVSEEMDIDLISYSKGNVSKERLELAKEVAEAGKLVDIERVQEVTDMRAKELTEENKAAKGEMAKFMVREAVVDAVIGGMIGASAGAVFDKVKGYVAARAANKANSAMETDAGDSAAETSVAEQPGEITAEPRLVEDEDGGYQLIIEKDGVEQVVVGEGNEPGIEFDSQTGRITEDSLRLLHERGIEIGEPREETIELGSGYTSMSNAEYFKVGGENYVEHANVNSVDFRQGYTTTSVKITEWVTDGKSNRMVDVSGVEIQNEGDLVMTVTPRAEGVDVDNLQVILTPEKDMGGTGIVLDVAPDGTVTIPAGSPAASMFADGKSFSGDTLEVVREASSGNGYEVLSTSSGSNTLEQISQSISMTRTEYVYNIAGHEFRAPDGVIADIDRDDFGVESLRNSDAVTYEYMTESTITVNGVAAGDAVETLQMPQRTGNYSEALDPFLSANKESRALNSENLVKKLVQENVGASADISGADADALLMESVNNGEISTQQVLNVYLEQMANSPEQLVEMRAMLGGFEMDINGDGIPDLIDTDWEINAAADILKNSAAPEGYEAVVNETYAMLYDKLNGGEIRLVNYAEEPYDYTTLGYIDKLNNVIHQFARKTTACNGVGIELLDKDGNSVYDEEVVRRIWKMSDNERIEHVTERLNCGQKTGDVGLGEKTGNEKTGSEKTGTEKTGTEKTGTEKTGTEKTGTEKTGSEKTGTEKTGTEKTGTEKTGTEKTGTEKTGSEKTGTEKTGTEKTGTEKTGTEKTGTEKTGSEKTGTEKTGTEKTGTEKTGTEKTGTEKTGTEKTGTEKTGSEKTGTEKTGTEKTGTELTGKTDYDRTNGRERTDRADTGQEAGRRDLEGDGSYSTPTEEMRGEGVIERTAVRDENGNAVTGDRGTYIQDNDAGGQVKTDEQVQEAIKRDVQTEYSEAPAGMRDEEIRTNPSGQSDIAGQTGISNPVPTPPPDLSDIGSAGENVAEESEEDMAERFRRFMEQQ